MGLCKKSIPGVDSCHTESSVPRRPLVGARGGEQTRAANCGFQEGVWGEGDVLGSHGGICRGVCRRYVS